MKFCLACEAEYTDWITTCSDCGAKLVESDSEDEPERVVYEVGTWPIEMQAAAAQAMAESGIPHAWIGPDLAVEEEHEEAVDAILDKIEADAGHVAADDPKVGEMSYELDEWTEDQRINLRQGLLDNGVAHRWEGEVLVVAIADEDTVDALLDQAEFSEEDSNMSPEIMGELFVAADQLRKDANDGSAMDSLATHLATMSPTQPPFGVERLVWKRIVDSANELSDTICDEAAAAEQVKARAATLRELLHPFV